MKKYLISTVAVLVVLTLALSIYAQPTARGNRGAGIGARAAGAGARMRRGGFGNTEQIQKAIAAIEAELAKLKKGMEGSTMARGKFQDMSEEERKKLMEGFRKRGEAVSTATGAIERQIMVLKGNQLQVEHQAKMAELQVIAASATKEKATATAKLIQDLIAKRTTALESTAEKLGIRLRRSRGQGQNIDQEGWVWENSVPNISGGTVQYSLLSPPRLEPDTIYPVILSLHGGGGSHLSGGGSWTRRQYYNDYRQQYPAYVVCPKSHHSTGVYATIIGVIESLPQVDLDRVYVMGHSYGGEGTTKVIGEFPNFFAAATPCAGGGLTRAGRTPFNAESVKHLPIWAFHGSIDSVCNYQFMKDNFNDAVTVGGNFKLTTWVGANHNVPDLFFVYDGGDSSIAGALGKFEALNECSTPGVCDEEMVYVKWLFKQNRKNQNPTTNSITAKPQTKNN